ncbi:hypothetical protein ACIBK9_28575 [Nonomuraea sp. NPDC050227]|uniref:hypothetical protein n=1 Tax=Nonomuraea sp. NPDC050227 TaxID=3364360 RepID=UPI0037B5AAD8
MRVLVEDAAELISSAYVQVDDSLGVRDRVRGGTQRRCLVQGLVGSVLVVEPFVLAQSVPQVVFVPYEAAVEKFVAA